MTLPVRTLVLFKHGVGYFVREGRLDGTTASLTFRQDEINDVLKSLTVLDRSGGHVLGVDYQTPMDAQDRWANTSIRMSPDASLRTLLVDLRGRRVTLTLPQGVKQGRVVGLDLADSRSTPDAEHRRDTVALLEYDGQVTVLPLREVVGIRIDDEQSRADLDYSLDTTASDGHRRELNIRLTEGEHDLIVHYVAPSPVWRVSYRVVAEGTQDQGQALLQAWGLFDNRLDEDLDEVRLMLVAGQPVSFIYDLYASHIPERPVIEEAARTVAGPIEFDAAPVAAAAPAPYAAPMADTRVSFAEAPPSWAMETSRERQADAAPAQAQGTEAGEFFQYEITTPVSVRRGESAIVPILNATVDFERELLFNQDKHDEHPVAALRLHNSSGLTLERGPATLVGDGRYLGDAIVPFTKDDQDLYLPYAVELGITVHHRTETRREIHRLRMANQYLIIDEFDICTHHYRVDSTNKEAQTVTIEAGIQHRDLVDSPEPAVETADYRRWRVSVPAGGSASLTFSERVLRSRREQATSLSLRQLETFFAQNLLDRAAYERLSTVLALTGRLTSARQELKEIDSQRQSLWQKQGQLRANLDALQATVEEQPLRARMLAGLTQAQDELDVLDRRQSELDEQIARTELERAEALDQLASEPTADDPAGRGE